ncbi:YozE family protein [Streptomyces sp. NBC_01235]|uniref:YozE family protein n=1 Tax=Streptomyces sp. NBC_01235 TaxID=2903788 RepID=UPI003FA35500
MGGVRLDLPGGLQHLLELIGDLARDVSADPDGPSHKGRQGRLDYLEERGAIDAAIETLARAWTQYEVYRAAQTD